MSEELNQQPPSEVGESTAAATSSKGGKPRRPPMLPNEIKCVLLQGFGSIKQLKAISIPRPKPGEGEVLVHVKSCGVTFLDLCIRQGQFNDLPKLPFVPGFECAGEIVQLGPNTTGFHIGERVICLPRFYAWSEYLAISGNLVYKFPDNMSYRQAAALPYSYLTAYILLFEIGGLKPGQSLLYHSAGGGVGLAITQLSKLVNNVKTIATCSKSKFDAIKHHVTHLLEESADYVQECKKLCPEGVDLVLDCLSGDNTNKGISVTKPLGKYIIYGMAKNLDGESKNYFALAKNWWHVDKISPFKLYEENRSISGFNLHNYLFNPMHSSRRFIQDIFFKLFNLYRDGMIKPIVDSVYSFDDVYTGLIKLQERKNIGKILIEPYLDESNRDKAEKDSHSSDTSGPDDNENEEAQNDLL